MANVFDYLKWRDDIELTKLNEVDALIFNKLVYFPLEKIIDERQKITILELYATFLSNEKLRFSRPEDEKLLKALSESIRYKNLTISKVKAILDYEKEEQFMACTIELPNNSIYIAFRGTTNNLIGWKENFNMSFQVTNSQIDALNYLNNSDMHKTIYLGGHSKGGNLAMYASVNTSKKIKNKIVKVYNCDGPGFPVLDANYYSIKDKIVSYIPSYSVVGRLLNLDNEIVVVKSNLRGIKQHDLYSWQVEKNKFVKGKIDEDSDIINNIIDDFFLKLTKEEMKEFVDNIFGFMFEKGIKKFSDLNISYLKDFVLSYQKMSNENKKEFLTVLKYLMDSTKENIGTKH